MRSPSLTMTVRSVTPPDPPEVIVSMGLSMMRLMTRVTSVGASSIRDTVAMPVAIDVTNETSSVRRMICVLFKLSRSIDHHYTHNDDKRQAPSTKFPTSCKYQTTKELVWGL